MLGLGCRMATGHLTTWYFIVYNKYIMARKKRGRPRLSGPKREVVFSIRLTPEERELIKKAAGPYPTGIWARVELVELARGRVKGKKKGGSR